MKNISLLILILLLINSCTCASVGWWNPSKDVFHKTQEQTHYAAGVQFKVTPEKCYQAPKGQEDFDPEMERLRKQRQEVLKTLIPILPAAGVRPTL